MKFTLTAASAVWDIRKMKEYQETLDKFNVKFNGKVYEIEINDWETFTKFIEEHDVIIEDDYSGNNRLVIIIYDDYIE